jgi:carboxymethylenebutenolidase
MDEKVRLKAQDGHELGVYVAHPDGEPISGLVVVQEIFGVNAHIRSVADGFARDGFLAVVPALFDRIERDVELNYVGDDMQKAMSFIPRLDKEKSVLDVAAAIDYAAKVTGRKVGIVGYCYGGTVAWVAAARFKIAAAVGYYGGHIVKFLDEKPQAPVMLHFGSHDKSIPAEDVERIRAAHPEVEIYQYDAGHAFNRDVGPGYKPDEAKLARERTLAFLKKHLAG